jgi:hypothetical protein
MARRHFWTYREEIDMYQCLVCKLQMRTKVTSSCTIDFELQEQLAKRKIFNEKDAVTHRNH